MKESKSLPVLDQLVVFQIESMIYSGKKKLTKNDFNIRDGELPPATLATLGSKWVCDPERIQALNLERARAHALLDRVSVKFLGGYGTPKAIADKVNSQLEAIVSRFNVKRKDFLDHYSSIIDGWVAKNPEYESSIRAAVPTKEYVEKRLFLEIQPFHVSEADAANSCGLVKAVNGLSDKLFEEIAQMAEAFAETRLSKREKITRCTVNPLEHMREKLNGLSFLDSRVMPVVQAIDSFLLTLPQKGALSVEMQNEVWTFTYMLSAEDRLKRFADNLAEGQSFSEVIGNLGVFARQDVQPTAIRNVDFGVGQLVAGGVTTGTSPVVKGPAVTISDLFDTVTPGVGASQPETTQALFIQQPIQPATQAKPFVLDF